MTSRIAFYAPLKPPTHPTPSGDRRFARLLLKALRHAGFAPELASALRSRNRDGDETRQRRIENRAQSAVDRLTQKYRRDPPALWFTYHLYYKAPDLIGPPVANALGIPYVLAEASRAARRANGPWRRGHELTDAALRDAALILQPNPLDLPEVSAFLGPDAPQMTFPPFLDAAAEAVERRRRDSHRTDFAQALSLDPALPWLIATGMMRTGVKRESHLLLAQAVRLLGRRAFGLILVGDGPARAEIEAAYGDDPRIRFVGTCTPAVLRRLNATADLFVWPAIGEAFGMAPLEAQAAGLPAVVGDRPGTRAMLRDGETAILTSEGDADALARGIADLLNDPTRRTVMGEAAVRHVRARHDIGTAAAALRTSLGPLIGERSRK